MFEAFALPPLAERTVATVLQTQAALTPDKAAVIDPTRSLTYEQLLDVATRTAGALEGRGVSRGDRVLLMLDNHVDWVVAWLGLAMLGAVEVPVNTAYKGVMLEHIISSSGADVLIVEAAYLPRIDELAVGRSRFRLVIERGATEGSSAVDWRELEGSGPPVLHENGPSDVAAIIYTSGTTGPSKGVVTPEAHAYGYATPAALGAPCRDDVSFVVLPLFHVGGHLCGVYAALIAGATAFIPPRFSTDTFWTEVRETGATFATLVGAMVNFLMAQPPSPDDAANPLRYAALAPISGSTAAFLKRFGMEACCSGYGSTEASSPLCVPLTADPLPFSIGWVRPDYEVAVVDEHDMPVAPGDVGEIVIRPREPWTLMAGYDGDPVKTARAWRNLWYHSGDLVSQRAEDGQFVLVDRLSDSIRRRGENISSYSIETVMNQHPEIIDSAAIGVPDELSGQEVLVVVLRQPESSLTERDFLEHLIERLPHFMVPRYVRFIDDDFERSASGKIKKDVLRSVGVAADTWDRSQSGIVVRRS